MRKRTISILSSLAVFLAVQVTNGQEPRDVVPAAEMRELEDKADKFLDDFESSDIGPTMALRDFVRSTPLEKRGEPLDRLIEQAGRLKDNYGKFSEHELVAARSLGKDLVVLRFLLKAEQFPIVWHFYFYRAPKTGAGMLDNRSFTLIEIRFDTNLDALDR